MGVAKNDSIRLLLANLLLKGFRQCPRIRDVMHEKIFLRERHDFSELEGQTDVHIALHDGDGCDEFQF